MADVTVDTSVPTGFRAEGLHTIVERDEDILYVFFTNTSGDLLYRKSTDGAATWAAATTVHSTKAVEIFDVYPDWWNAGDTGLKIHIVYVAADGGGTIREYISLDTSDDSLGSAVSIGGAGGVNGTNSWHDRGVTIWKSRADRIHVHVMQDNGATDQIHSVSEDGGATWDDTRTPIATGTGARKCIGLPGNELSVDDVWLFQMTNDPTIRISVYDHSADSWSDTSIVTLTTADNDNFQMAAVTRHKDNHVILVASSEPTGSAMDMRAWDVTQADDITELTIIRENFNNTLELDLHIDQCTGDLYAVWLNGTPGSSVQAYYSKSTDKGSTWGGSTLLTDTADNHDMVRVSPMGHKNGGRVIAFWYNQDLDTLVTSKTRSVETDSCLTPPVQIIGFVQAVFARQL